MKIRHVLFVVLGLLAVFAIFTFLLTVFFERPFEKAAVSKILRGNYGNYERSSLDGLKKERAILEGPVFSVMVDNHPDGRKYQRGLNAASLVYEALAEGGITRLMAFFESGVALEVGPVRSARANFVEIAKFLGGIHIHIGGSPEALALLARQKEIFDFDGMAYEGSGPYFLRDKNIASPHNLFVNLAEAAKKAKETMPEKSFSFEKELFSFSLSVPAQVETVTAVNINFLDRIFRVRYEYDPVLHAYKRFLGGEPHTDTSTGSQLFASNIIIQFVKYWPVDAEGRLHYQLTGEGEAWFMRDSKFIKGKWKNTDAQTSKTEFFDGEGKPFLLRPGATWVTLIDSPKKVITEKPSNE